ncbi:MAG TPA: beta galactosidase jelly roll domain-containing protein, partial [Nitrososphaera sp.]|nr:beta galactosidase jelly roll domain-containing protein [Nitrososphaera sp.]
MKRLMVGVAGFLMFSLTVTAETAKPSPSTLPLNNAWFLQSSSEVKADGAAISTSLYRPQGWYAVNLPTTVARALVQNKVVPEPYFGMNLRKLPGVTYPIGENFSNLAMAADSPFAVSWWYRKTFVLPTSYKGKNLWLNFKGINYRANIWLNGKQIADKTQVAGAWRTYEFDVTNSAKTGNNVLAVEVFAPTETDLAITFVDWNPSPPDKNMGLFRDVFLAASGPVALRYPTVISKVDSPANDKAHLSVTALLKNSSDHPV